MPAPSDKSKKADLKKVRKLSRADKLTKAAADRLYFLLEGKYPTKKGASLLAALLTENVPADPFNLRLLMLVGAGLVCIRAHVVTPGDLAGLFKQTGSLASQERTARRFSRAMRLLKRLIRAGCESRGEV